MDKEIFKKGINFECQGSSNCCVSRGNYGYVYLSKKDQTKIVKYLNLSTNLFKKKYCEFSDGYLHLKELNIDGNCQFLKNKKCSIYAARPIQCRTWPFWKENMNAKKWKEELIDFCPGIGKGRLISASTIQKKINRELKNDKQIIKEDKA
jgi:Fe-S-cluster containining protein